MVSTPEEITDFLDKLDKGADVIEDQVADISLFGLGGITWTEAWGMSSLQREKVIKKLNKYYQKQSGQQAKEYM